MIKKISIIICLCLGLTFVACTKDTETTEANKPNTLITEPSEPEKDTTTKETHVVKDIILTTYTVNENTFEIERLSDITVKEDLPIQEKLTTLANELSTRAFNGLSIRIVEIVTSNDSKNAIINLEDSGNDPAKSWSKNYFQGSSGGITTSKLLIQTLIQNSYLGDWVDSLQFQYNGAPIQYEHVEDLKGTIKR